VVFNPAWTKAESLSDQQIERVDVKVFTLSIGAAYRLNPYTTIFGDTHSCCSGSASSRRRRTSTPIRIGSRSVSSSATVRIRHGQIERPASNGIMQSPAEDPTVKVASRSDAPGRL